jgi:DNA-binding protein HU-beta
VLEELATMAMRETLTRGAFLLPWLGKLILVERKARVGRNPATGEKVQIPTRKALKFSVVKSVKEELAKK